MGSYSAGAVAEALVAVHELCRLARCATGHRLLCIAQTFEQWRLDAWLMSVPDAARYVAEKIRREEERVDYSGASIESNEPKLVVQTYTGGNVIIEREAEEEEASQSGQAGSEEFNCRCVDCFGRRWR